MGVRADDDVGPGVGETPGERALAGGRASPALDSPVQVDRDNLAVGRGGADGGQQPGGVTGRRQAESSGLDIPDRGVALQR